MKEQAELNNERIKEIIKMNELNEERKKE